MNKYAVYDGKDTKIKGKDSATMGMAASQARLLSITSRMADNELRAQIVNNSKMRLAADSSQASEDYVQALNDATMMFTNYDAAGNDQYQKLNFNNLTQYSSYNTQYGLTNTYGQLMISENEAKLYKAAGGSLDKYLELHGLEKDTSYFTAATFGAESFNIEYYDEEVGKTYNLGTFNVGELKNMYYGLDGYDGYANNIASSEDYAKRSESIQKAYNKLRNTDPAFEDVQKKIDTLIGDQAPQPDDYSSTADYISALIAYTGASTYSGLRNSALSLSGSTNGHLTFNKTKLETLLNNEGFQTSPTTALLNKNGYYLTSSTYSGKKYWYKTIKLNSTDNKDSSQDTFGLYYGANLSDSSNGFTPSNGKNDGTSSEYTRSIDWYESGKTYKYWYYPTPTGTTNSSGDRLYNISGNNLACSIYETGSGYYEKHSGGDWVCLGTYNKGTNTIAQFILKDTDKDSKFDSPADDKDIGLDLLRDFLKEHLMECFDYTVPTSGTGTAMDDLASFLGTYYDGVDLKLYEKYDLSKLGYLLSLNEDSETVNDISAFNSNANLRAVKENFILDTLFDNFGEPNEGWLIKDNLEEDANPKVQWYTNIFNKIAKCGYAVLENGLASSNEWIQFALESGLVNIEQVDKQNMWNATLHSNIATITEVTDDVAVARAEAKYKKTMNDIENKDKRLDIELKNIDTEHNALQTEYESVKNVISKNIERSFKMYNA